MMSATHAAIGIAGVSLALGTANPWLLLCGALSSQLPDLDTTSSWIGRVLYPIANFFETHYPHRSITHSFISTVLVSIALTPLWFIGWQYWIACILGQFLGWFSDCFTKSGVAAFYPNTARLVIPGNPRARIKSHSDKEYWILAAVMVVAVAAINLASAGGVSEVFGKAFFRDVPTAAKLFQKYGHEKIVLVDVTGMHSQTNAAIQQQYKVLEAKTNELIGESTKNGKLYKIGGSPDAQIRPNSVVASVGDPVNIQAEEQSLIEIGVDQWLRSIPQNSYISGSLLLDDIDDIRLSIEIEAFPTIQLFGPQIELRNARPTEIYSHLGEFWILTGKAIIKTRT